MLRFETNAKCAGCSAAIARALAPLTDAANVDLTTTPPILTVNADVDPQAVIQAVTAAGFTCTQL